MHVGIATYARLPQLVEDDQLIMRTLREHGHVVDAVIWDDPTVTWPSYDTVLVRSCWDYHKRPVAFLAWIDRLEGMQVQLWNPPQLLRWNHDKHYLIELAAQAVPVVPTIYIEQGTSPDLAHLLNGQQWERAVVKPAIAATAFHTWQTNSAQATNDQQRFMALTAERSMLIQPLMPEIMVGEWSLIFFGGIFSHAVLKRPAPGDFRSQDDFGGTAELCDPPPGMVEQAIHILDRLRSPWLYA